MHAILYVYVYAVGLCSQIFFFYTQTTASGNWISTEDKKKNGEKEEDRPHKIML